MREGGYSDQNEDENKEKYLAKEMRVYIFVDRVIDGEMWLHDLGGVDVSYHSDTPFERIDDGYTTECRPGMIFVTWFIVKLYCHVTLCINFHILIVYNDISHLGIKVISWSWLVGDVTKIPDFSDHIQVNCLFFTREKYCKINLV